MMKTIIQRFSSFIALSTIAVIFNISAHAGGSLHQPSLWQGSYFGVHAGGSFSDDFDGIEDAFAVIAEEARRAGYSARSDGDFDSFVGGIHVGYNIQKNNLVFGVEGDVTFSGSETSLTISDGDTSGSIALEQSYLASLRARLGYAYNNTLIYGTAGVAWTNLELSASISDGDLSASASADDTFTGFVAGGGIEHKLSSQMSLRGEALHYSFDDNGLEFDNTVVRGGLTWHLN